MKKISLVVLCLISIGVISCRDSKKEQEELDTALDKIETVEKQMDDTIDELDRKAKEAESALIELDSL